MKQKTNHRSKRWIIGAIWGGSAVLGICLAAYALGYVYGGILGGSVSEFPGERVRSYPLNAIARIYVPAAWIESKVYHTRVILGSTEYPPFLFTSTP